MNIKTSSAPCICCYTTLWNISGQKKAINDKLQGSVATYLRCDGVVNNQIKKSLLLSLWVNFFYKSVNIWQSYIQARAWLSHALCAPGQHTATRQSAWDNRVLAFNFTKYLPILTDNFTFSLKKKFKISVSISHAQHGMRAVSADASDHPTTGSTLGRHVPDTPWTMDASALSQKTQDSIVLSVTSPNVDQF